MNDDLRTELAAAIERYLVILADHGLILAAECDWFIRQPVHGVYTILVDAMQTIDPDFPRVERLRSNLDSEGEHDSLEEQLIEFARVLKTFCANYHASTGVDPIKEPSDPTGGRVAVALVSVDIAVERLRAEAAARGDGPADLASSEALGELRAEDTAVAIERHLAMRRSAE